MEAASLLSFNFPPSVSATRGTVKHGIKNRKAKRTSESLEDFEAIRSILSNAFAGLVTHLPNQRGDTSASPLPSFEPSGLLCLEGGTLYLVLDT